MLDSLNAWMAPLLAAVAGCCALLSPLALHRSMPQTRPEREWRDRMPLILRLLRPAIRLCAPAVDKSLPAHKREILQTQLNSSGAGYLLAPAEFIVIQRFAVLAGVSLALYVGFVLDMTDPLYLALLGSLAPFAYLYPQLWLRDARKRRQAHFEKAFPFFLDVLVLGMKAGLTFGAAMEQAIEQSTPGPLREEFSRYLRETRTGVARRVALDRLASRVVLPAVTNFVASVIQAEETGGSLGDVLADQARQRRQERFLRAEKLANQAPVKMLFPLIALLFPITFIIIGFPIVIQLMQAGALDIF